MVENDIKGRARGGKARAEALTPQQRKAISRKALEARWGKDTESVLRATHGSKDHPLKIGDIEIPCYVLEDGTRVLSQTGLISGLGMSKGSSGAASSGGDRLTVFLGGKSISQFVSNDLVTVSTHPIKFKIPTGGRVVHGYPATILVDICEAVLKAREAKTLVYQQLHIAKQCEVLVRGFARVGIIALVDEATGYQKDRTRDALSKILEAFIAKELQPYLPTFPADFYKELFRLRGIPFPESNGVRPRYFGILTNDIIYNRLAPGVLEELKKTTERDVNGRPKNKFFQKLTANTGYPKLREHLGAVIALMRVSKDYREFLGRLNQFYPPQDVKQLALDLRYDPANDTGSGI